MDVFLLPGDGVLVGRGMVQLVVLDCDVIGPYAPCKVGLQECSRLFACVCMQVCLCACMRAHEEAYVCRRRCMQCEHSLMVHMHVCQHCAFALSGISFCSVLHLSPNRLLETGRTLFQI